MNFARDFRGPFLRAFQRQRGKKSGSRTSGGQNMEEELATQSMQSAKKSILARPWQMLASLHSPLSTGRLFGHDEDKQRQEAPIAKGPMPQFLQKRTLSRFYNCHFTLPCPNSKSILSQNFLCSLCLSLVGCTPRESYYATRRVFCLLSTV